MAGEGQLEVPEVVPEQLSALGQASAVQGPALVGRQPWEEQASPQALPWAPLLLVLPQLPLAPLTQGSQNKFVLGKADV